LLSAISPETNLERKQYYKSRACREAIFLEMSPSTCAFQILPKEGMLPSFRLNGDERFLFCKSVTQQV
jgi:hypothetical protein